MTLNVSNKLINNESIIIDDNSEKQNKLMPGIHLPVRKWNDAIFEDFDRVLILSWNYKDNLIDRLKEEQNLKIKFYSIHRFSRYRDLN